MRKLEWKAFWHDNPRETEDQTDDIHKDLRIPSGKHPEGYSNPLMDEIKTKIMGFVDGFIPGDPKKNLSVAEKRGKDYIMGMHLLGFIRKTPILVRPSQR